MSEEFHIAAFWCWYRGARFAGFQAQTGLRTVQAELLRAFREAGLERNPVVAGRTDKGVSARMQVLSGRVRRGASLDEVMEKLNASLPGDMGVHLVRSAKPKFHAAWSACSKEYRYRLTEPVDEARLGEALALVPGTRDFRVFHFKTSQVRPRTVQSVDVIPGEALTLRFIGEGFGRYMVRMLVGGACQVARGEISLDTFRAGLEQQQNFNCPKAPPEPLTLWSVNYPSELDPFTAADRASQPPL